MIRSAREGNRQAENDGTKDQTKCIHRKRGSARRGFGTSGARRTIVAEAAVGVRGVKGKCVAVMQKHLQGGRRNGKAKPFGARRGELHIIHTDDFALEVEQWSARVARVNLRGCL